MKRLLIVTFSLIFLAISLTQSAELKLVQSVDRVTRTEEGGGARPEILYRNSQFYIVYRDTYTQASGIKRKGLGAPSSEQGSFRLKVLDKEMNPTGVEKVLVTSDNKGGVTDIRLTSDGRSIFIAYEKATPQGRSLFLEKYNTSFNRLLSREVATAGLPGKGVEALDDPAIVVANHQVYVSTKIGYGKGDQSFRIRGFDDGLNIVWGPQEVGAGLALGLGNVPSILFQNSSFHLVTAVHVSGKPLCPQADATTNNDLFVFQFRPDWTYAGVQKKLTHAPHIEYYPTGLRYSNGKYYVTYLVNDPESYLPHCGKGGNLGIGTVMLKVFDSNWNPLAEVKATDSGELANHPTVEVVGDQIYVAYGRKEAGAGLGPGSSNVKMKVYQLQE
ncbi:MAG: hypothetical protein HY538_04070 [Deltaproteobacteria bacterium]|nr:hypothetical protein [Deltaproteobacteria bacterium]